MSERFEQKYKRTYFEIVHSIVQANSCLEKLCVGVEIFCNTSDYKLQTILDLRAFLSLIHDSAKSGLQIFFLLSHVSHIVSIVSRKLVPIVLFTFLSPGL